MKTEQRTQFDVFKATMAQVVCPKCGLKDRFWTAGTNSHVLRAKCLCGEILAKERVQAKADDQEDNPTGTVFEKVDD